MGMALGWISIALAGLVGAPKPERTNAELQYTVRFIEAEGLGWRKALFSDLTPVARQGAATIWTAPRSAARRLSDEVSAQRHGRVVCAPRVTTKSGDPAHVSMRSTRRLITQVAWNGEDEPEPGKPEVVRTGPVATMVGRKLDQGVLVQMVLEDTQVSAVHHVLLGKAEGKGEAAARTWRKAGQSARKTEEQDDAPGSHRIVELLEASERMHEQVDAALRALEALGPPQYLRHSPSGPSKDLVAVDECEWPGNAPEVCRASAEQQAKEKAAECEENASTVAVDVPEITHQEIAGEWLVPNDGVLLVSFGPNTTTDEEGKAVVRERLAIIEARADSDGAVPMEFTAAPSNDAPPRPIVVPPPAPEAMAVPDVPEPAPVPNLPSRTIPRGVNPDGTPAPLPPLPASEAVPPPSISEGKPVPTPQTKQLKPVEPAKPAGPTGPARPSPSIDTDAKPTSFSAPARPMPMPLPMAMTMPARGLQFLVPMKPISLRLPFNQRLEIEIFGRIVPAPKPGPTSSERTAKGD